MGNTGLKRQRVGGDERERQVSSLESLRLKLRTLSKSHCFHLGSEDRTNASNEASERAGSSCTLSTELSCSQTKGKAQGFSRESGGHKFWQMSLEAGASDFVRLTSFQHGTGRET